MNELTVVTDLWRESPFLYSFKNMNVYSNCEEPYKYELIYKKNLNY